MRKIQKIKHNIITYLNTIKSSGYHNLRLNVYGIIYTHIHIHIHTHTDTHTHIYIYSGILFLCILLFLFIHVKDCTIFYCDLMKYCILFLNIDNIDLLHCIDCWIF